ncbi:MAG: CNNM domain-containing protein [Thermodesulfobacteriota bacterium]
MLLLLFYLFLALGFSFLCSVMESVLLSITPSFVAAYEEKSPVRGRHLRHLKTDIDRPLAAILSLNTIAHTVGAAGVGAQAMVVFGSRYVAVTSAVLTFLILVLSEIIPKTIGAMYWRQLIAPTVMLMRTLIVILYPLVWLSKWITILISGNRDINGVTRDEIRALAELGVKQGVFFETESRILKNLMRFGQIRAKDVMTPRTVIFALPEDMKLRRVYEIHDVIRVSRIPLYAEDRHHIGYYILKDDILLNLAHGKGEKPLKSLGRKILPVPETITLFRLFEQLLNRREHIALVVDEYGGVAGIATMEDIIETLLGTEIVDETDAIQNMRQWARKRWYHRAKSQGLISEDSEQAPAGEPENKA